MYLQAVGYNIFVSDMRACWS